MNDDITEVLDDWIADRRLSRRKKAFLETVYDQFLETSGGAYAPSLSGSDYSSWIDLPSGSYLVQVVAALLDHVDPLPEPPCRLVEVTEQLVEDGHIEREAAEAFYEEALQG